MPQLFLPEDELRRQGRMGSVCGEAKDESGRGAWSCAQRSGGVRRRRGEGEGGGERVPGVGRACFRAASLPCAKMACSE